MAEWVVRGKPGAGRGFWVALAVLVGCLVLVAVAGVGAFDDDEGGTHEAGTDALRAEGILEGTECGEGRICPAEAMLRWVMAVWLVRAVDGADPAGAVSGRFSDVPSDEWWAAHVERLAELGVTLGCGDGTGFCPTDAVTRAQMATFLVRAFGLDAEGGSGFTDIAGSTHEASINVLAAERVTAGCSTSPLRYCPNRSVTRGQMTTFLARALDLIPRPQPAERTGQRIAYTVTTENGNQELWVIHADRATQTKTTELPDGATFEQVLWSPDGGYFAYEVDTDEGRQLWVADADGANPTQLSDDAYSAVWSPDGSRIAYIAGTEIPSVGYQLWVADADGSNRKLLDDDAWDRPVWSPDGTKIAVGVRIPNPDGDDWSTPFVTGGLVMDTDGTNKRLFADGPSSGLLWSPDGIHIAYIYRPFDPDIGWSEDQLWVVDADGTNPTKLGDNLGWGSETDWDWSPDGAYIAYVAHDGDQLWVVDADGANPTKLTDSLRWHEWNWSPDGTHIAYELRTDDGSSQLWVVDADGANPTQLSDNAGLGVWSPDGTDIAYITTVQTGDDWIRQLWVVDADGTNPTKLADGIRWFRNWSPDGRRIGYTVQSDDGLWVVDADGTNPTRLSTVVYDERSGRWMWSWSPHGGRIVYITTVQTGDDWIRQLWVVDADGTDNKLIDAGWPWDPVWSPDGTHIVYSVFVQTGENDWIRQLWVVDADGTDKKLLTSRRLLDGDAGKPIWWLFGSQ